MFGARIGPVAHVLSVYYAAALRQVLESLGTAPGDNELLLVRRPAVSMKKTDLEKRLAKKLDGRMKTGAVPQRFAKGAALAKAAPEEKSRPPVVRLVPITCRLPAKLVERLREHAIGREGGMSALVAQAVEQWLASAGTKAEQ